MITEQAAIESAKARLDLIHAPYQGRRTTVTLEGDRYKVVFWPPKGQLAGEFTVFVNAESGEAIDFIIRR